jgi:hypothetical protein
MLNAIAQALKAVFDKAGDHVANPARVSDPDKLRAAASGKTALVTGASYGIGEATARGHAPARAPVLAVAPYEDKLRHQTA